VQRDRAAVYAALREGRCYLAVDPLGPPSGFAFWADDAPMGAEAPAGQPHDLHVRMPRPARIRLLRDGALFASADHADSLDVTCSEPGVYRVEVDIGERVWIVTNPIYLRAHARS
jgi:hypothetical protein